MEQQKEEIERAVVNTGASKGYSQRSGGVDNCVDLADLAILYHLKQPMWDKAKKLATDDSAIVKAPGDDGGSMFKSSCGKKNLTM